jgi:2'-5' RNA ligase
VPRRRLGVALLVPPPVAVEVDGLRRALGDPSRRRIPPHLTLVPPVNVREDDVGAALDVLRQAARAVPPLDLRLGPAATFHPVNPVVYLAVDGALGGLAELRARVFVPPLERSLAHPFVPHVTVADELDPDRIRAAVTALADYVVDVRIEAVHLLEEGRDRVWRPIADAPLSRRARPV